MKITRGDQFEIGDCVLINGEPYVAINQDEVSTLFKHELDNEHQCDRYIYTNWESRTSNTNVELNTQSKQDIVKVENESEKKVRIEKIGEAVVVTVY